MLPSVDDIKLSLRISHNEDDKMINLLINTASHYILSSISVREDDFKAISEYQQYEWAVSLLVQHWYLNRQEASSHHIPLTVSSLIQQMRGRYYVDH